jgi:hypothetical protein
MATNFPGSADTDSTVGGNATDNPASGDATDTPSHSELHQDVGDAIQELEGKLGTGASVAAANQVLTGNGSGTSTWATVSNAAMGLAWTDYSWTDSTTLEQNATGVLSTGLMKYLELGDFGLITGVVTVGASGSSGDITLAIPGSGAVGNDSVINGSFRFLDASVPASKIGHVLGSTTTDRFTFYGGDASSNGELGAAYTVASGDKIQIFATWVAA